MLSSVLSFRIRNCLTQLYAKDITPDDKQELDEALQREVCRYRDVILIWISSCYKHFLNKNLKAQLFSHMLWTQNHTRNNTFNSKYMELSRYPDSSCISY